MSVEEILEFVGDWFAGVGGASLKLPSRWFGRPHDNQHRLTGASVSAGRLLLELDRSLLLTLAHPSSVAVEGGCLEIAGFTHGTLDWDDFGGSASHLETFEAGVVEFHA